MRTSRDSQKKKLPVRASYVQQHHSDAGRKFVMKFKARSLKSERSCLPSKRGRKGLVLFSVGTLAYIFMFRFRTTYTPVPVSRKATSKKDFKRGREDNFDSLRGVHAFKVKANLNRLHVPWFRRPSTHPLSKIDSNYRFLYTPIRTATSDGIGHSMGVVNHEFNIALHTNLTYAHRVGLYSSLTANDSHAVEDFFGWGDGEFQRSEIQREGCHPKGGRWPSAENIYDCHECKKPSSNGALGIKHLVQIPPELSGQCHDRSCLDDLSKLVRNHPESRTVFQLSSRGCRPPVTDSNYLMTKGLFYGKYWNRHALLLNKRHLQPTWKSRPIRYREEELNIALHIRRGDFLKPETQNTRSITDDSVFATVVMDALSIVNQTGGVFAGMPVVIHLYSEGKLKPRKNYKSVHAVNLQDQRYYDSTGVARDREWWKDLILKTQPSHKLPQLASLGKRLRVEFHISEDTIQCLHEMASADIFVGSKSGLSNALIWSLSRGVVLIPHAGTINNEIGKKGYLCCSLPFDNRNGSYVHALFKRYWKAYVQANEESVKRALRAPN